MSDRNERLRAKFRELTNAVRASRLGARVKRPEPPAAKQEPAPEADLEALEAMLKGG